MRMFWLALYYGFAYHLPGYHMPLIGKLCNSIRISILRHLMPVGKNCRIMKHVYVGNGKNISIGDNCRINDEIRLDNVSIGNHVMIARESIILGKMHGYGSKEIPMEMQHGNYDMKSVIEDDVWFGLRVIMMPGLTVKKGCIVGAAAVLTKDTVEYGIYGGVPAKLIKMRD